MLFTFAEGCVRCAIGAVELSRQRTLDGSERADQSECCRDLAAVLRVFTGASMSQPKLGQTAAWAARAVIR